MQKVEIPFQPEFEEAMLLGRKTMTSRTKRYGYEGDYFEAFGRVFVLTAVYKIPLARVAYHHYSQEGFESPEGFIDIWRKLHRRVGYNPDRIVFCHEFKNQRELAFFHIHRIDHEGYCEECHLPVTQQTEEE